MSLTPSENTSTRSVQSVFGGDFTPLAHYHAVCKCRNKTSVFCVCPGCNQPQSELTCAGVWRAAPLCRGWAEAESEPGPSCRRLSGYSLGLLQGDKHKQINTFILSDFIVTDVYLGSWPTVFGFTLLGGSFHFFKSDYKQTCQSLTCQK